MLCDQRFQLADELAVAAAGKVRFDPILQGRQTRLLQPADRRLRPALIGKLGQRRPAPKRERLGHQCSASTDLTGGDCLTAACSELLEA